MNIEAASDNGEENTPQNDTTGPQPTTKDASEIGKVNMIKRKNIYRFNLEDEIYTLKV